MYFTLFSGRLGNLPAWVISLGLRPRSAPLAQQAAASSVIDSFLLCNSSSNITVFKVGLVRSSNSRCSFSSIHMAVDFPSTTFWSGEDLL